MARSKSNVLISKLFQSKYDGITDPAGSVSHYQTWINPRWSVINPTFIEKRTLSLPLFLGVRFLMVGVQEMIIGPQGLKVVFSDAVRTGNSQLPDLLRSDLSTTGAPVAGFSSLAGGEHLRYITNSRSRGATTAGQGAADCLAASVLFAEALRRLIYFENCPFAKEAVKSFLDIYSPGKNGASDQNMMDCADALYMVGTYLPTGEKLATMTEHVSGFDIPGESYFGDELSRLLSPTFLRYLI